MGTTTLESYVTTGQAAHILRLSEATIRAWADAKKVTVLRDPRGRRLLVKAEIERLAKERGFQGDSWPPLRPVR
jgi:excisionase family DNA binding protein